MRHPRTSAGAPVSLRVRRRDELVDARRVDAVGCEVGAPARAHAVGEGVLGRRRCRHDEAPRPRVVRRGREARGLDERVERRARSTRRVGRNDRIERRGLEERRARRRVARASPEEVLLRRADRARARSRRGTTTGRGRARSRRGRRRPCPSRARPRDAISSATATSVTCSTRPSASGVSRRSTTAAMPAHADRDVGEAVAPRPAERVGDDHRDLDAAPRAERVAHVLGRAVGVDGQQRGPALLDVRQVDARVRAHEAVARSR